MQEEGDQPKGMDYYNIMVIGTTGQGKSTTADKLLIANPTQHRYEGGVPQRDPVLNEENRQLKMDDITMWLLHASNEAPEDAQHKMMEQDNLQCANTRVKCLVYFRNKKDPHREVNRARGTEMNIFSSTKHCEVLSNETSKVRVMDVPGFFDQTSLVLRNQNPGNSLENLQVNNLDIMRRIVRIQTTLGMKFHRILYFLPCRGHLERADAHLKLELEWMVHYFGKFIFQCMVLVATIPSNISEDEDYPEHKKFPESSVKSTKDYFQKALTEVLSPDLAKSVQCPPLIFISLTDSCEKILEKVRGAYETDVSLNLEFDPKTCANCGVKIGVVKDQKVTCHFKSNTIPYEDSTCHPKLVAKYSRADKVWGEFKHVVLFKWVRNPWPVFVGEECASCKQSPDTLGCVKVGTQFPMKLKKKLETITVDHTNVFDEEVPVIIGGGADGQQEQPDEDERDADEQLEEEGANVQESMNHADTVDRHRPIHEEGAMAGGVEASVAYLSLHCHHVPNEPPESQNPCYDQKGA